MDSVVVEKKRRRDWAVQDLECGIPPEIVQSPSSGLSPDENSNSDLEVNSSDPDSNYRSESEEDIVRIEDSYIQKNTEDDQKSHLDNIDLFYDSENSENERTLITIGNVPVRWYDDLDHIGYDQDGQIVEKPKYEDEIDTFVALNKSNNSWKSVYDEKTGKRYIITEQEIDIIKRLRNGVMPERYDAQHWFIPVATKDIDIMPKSNVLPAKSSFIPRKWEAVRMRKIADAIKKGRIKLNFEKKIEKKFEFFPIWDQVSLNEEPIPAIFQNRLNAPKEKLPGNSESYNPPPEFLMTEEEEEQWSKLDFRDRKQKFLPRKYENLHSIPMYPKYVSERFQRCLDLYLASRMQIKRKKCNMSNLLPNLPSPSELKPYPTIEVQAYIGHQGKVHCISVDPTGCWLISGGEDCTLRLWEIKSTRCIQTWKLYSPVMAVAWNPNPQVSIVAVATSHTVKILEMPTASPLQVKLMGELFANFRVTLDSKATGDASKWVNWIRPTDENWKDGWRVDIEYNVSLSGKDTSKLAWHHKGDYFSTTAPKSTPSVLVHQLSKRKTQAPWKRAKMVTCSIFHPSKPFFLLATQRQVYIYNLMTQSLVKKLQPGVRWISDMAVHPQGDNLIIGSYDKKVCWFDLDMGVKPFKVMRHHKAAIRSVVFHKHYPLFASSSDDGTVQIFHGTVYDDIMSNPMIVPLKILRGHKIEDNVGVLNAIFHPIQPWIFSSGADSTIRLFV